jgi:hypothetical protein
VARVIARRDLVRLMPGLACFALITAIAVMAGDRFVQDTIDAAGDDPGRLWWLGLVVMLGVAVVALGRWAPTDRLSLPLVASLLVLYVGLRVTAMALAPAPVVSDWARYDALAREILASGPRLDVVPTGFPTLLAGAYAVGGANASAGQTLQLIIGSLTGVAAYALAATAWNHRVAAIGLLLLAVAPSQILLGTVLASEPLYTLLAMLAALALVHSPGPASAAIAGVLLAASQYVRPTSLALIPLFAWLAWRWQRRASPHDGTAWRAPAALALAFVAVLLPVVVWNLTDLGTPSLSTSRLQNYSLFVGLNQDTDGRFNPSDLELVGGEFGTPASEARAREGAIARVKDDPLGTMGLVLRKVWQWGDEDYGAYWAFGVVDDRGAGWAVGVLLSRAWWAVVAILAAVAVAFTPIANRLTQLTVGSIAVVGLVHLALEAQGRYHAWLVPFVAILAAAALGTRLGMPGEGPDPATTAGGETGR